MFGIPLGELGLLAAAIAIAGVVTGLLAGLFGIGGGAIIVPVLYEVFRVLGVPEEVRMQLCIGTSLAIIIPTNIRSYITHRTRDLVLKDVVRLWAIPAIFGVAVGSLAAAFAPPAVFKIAFAVIAGSIALKVLFGRQSWQISSQLPGPRLMRVYGFIVGLNASLMGVSGGSSSNIILTLYGKTIHQAVATSAALGIWISIAGTLGYVLAGLPHQSQLPFASIGFVSLLGLVLMAPVSTLMAPYGARLAHVLSRRRLEIVFGIFLLLASARFLASVIV
jgi:uncharacterized membrane protein YfcA